VYCVLFVFAVSASISHSNLLPKNLLLHTQRDAKKTCIGNFAPQPSKNLETCCWYSGSTCCINSVINVSTLAVQLRGIHAELGHVDSDCYFALADLFCSLCSPNSAEIFQSVGGKVSFFMCNSECNKLYDACLKNVGYLFPNITDLPTNGPSFCTMMFTAEESITVTLADKDCFAGASLNKVKKSGCVPDVPAGFGQASGLSGGAIFGIVVGVTLFVCVILIIIAGLAFYFYRRSKPQNAVNNWFPDHLFGRKGKGKDNFEFDAMVEMDEEI